jgi:protein SCO1/2
VKPGLRVSLRRALAAVLGVLLLSALAATADEQPSAAKLMDDLMWERGPIGGPFALIDHTGKPRTDADFRGKLMIIYFGYSYCPDICQTDLMSILGATRSSTSRSTSPPSIRA